MTSAQLATIYGLLDTALVSCGLAKGSFSDIKGDGSLYHSGGYVFLPASLDQTGSMAERLSSMSLKVRIQIAWTCAPSSWQSLMSTATSTAISAVCAINGIDWSTSLQPQTVCGQLTPGNGTFEYLPEGVLYFFVELPINFRHQWT